MVSITHSRRYFLLTTIFMVSIFVGACAPTPKPTALVNINEPPPVHSEQDTFSEPVGQRGPVKLRPDHPQTYVVASGDTLLDVAEQFLEDPWRWTEVWQPNANLDEPERIYPGEVIELYYENGQPRLRLLSATERPTIKLSPQIRVASLSQPIPTVPRQAIASFLERSMVMNEADWEKAPHIAGSIDDRILLATGDRIYVRGIADFDQRSYQVFRPSDEEYRDPQSGQSLGIGGIYMGNVVLEEEGDPATFMLTSARKEIREGDRLVPQEDIAELYSFTPHPAPLDTEGHIIAFLNEAVSASQYQSVVLDLGEWEGIEPGHVLKVFSADEQITDPVTGSTVSVPGKRAGLVMVYKVHDWVSYALITEMSNRIRVGDRVREP